MNMNFDWIGRGIGMLLMMMTTLWVVLCPSLASDDLVLWWMFDDTTKIEDVNGKDLFLINELVGRGDASGKTVNGIRIGAYSGNELLGYLTMEEGSALHNPTVYDMPSWNWDTLDNDSWSAGPTYAYLSGYDSSPSVSFMIELGNWNNDDGIWSILAHSDRSTASSLREFMDVSNLEMHSTLEWTGGSYSVPEPNSGMLILLGFCILVMRRKIEC